MTEQTTAIPAPTVRIPGQPLSISLTEPEPVTAVKAFVALWRPKLVKVLADFNAALGEEAASWPLGAAYIRESCALSLIGESPDVQLHNVLQLMRTQRFRVSVETLFFEVRSSTQIATRGEFKRLLELALAGGVTGIGVFLSDRLFRNVEESSRTKNEFRRRGIELFYLGKFEGDQRHPAAWHLETMQDVANELHARNTSYYVGMNFEHRTAMGKPAGRLPEVYVVGERAQSFMGRRGSIQTWELTEPLSRILRDGKDRVLAGASMAELALWSIQTELGAVTLAGHKMNKLWWYRNLRDPRYAGYQRPTEYMGFGPSAPKRPKRKPDSPLVPAVTPALWTLEEHRQILALCSQRAQGSKERKSYEPYLLAGIAIDGRCGHPMQVRTRSKSGKYALRCGVVEVDGHLHGRAHRADLAGAELDELIGYVSFEDADFLRQVEEEVRDLDRREHEDRERFVPDPAIAAARQAMAAISAFGMEPVRASLEAQVARLEEADGRRRDALTTPVVEFRRAIEAIKSWKVVWKEADVRTKNKLLRDFGLRVTLAQLPEDEGKQARPFWIREIAADNPVFELALVAALRARNEGLVGHGTYCATNDPIRLRLRLAPPAVHSFLDPQNLTHVNLVRRPVGSPDETSTPDVWLTPAEFARQSGERDTTVRYWLRVGRLKTVHKLNYSRGAVLISSSELPVGGPKSIRVWGADAFLSPRESSEIAIWIGDRLRCCSLSRRALADLTRLSVLAIRAIQIGTSQPDLRSARLLAAFFDHTEPSPQSDRFLGLLEAKSDPDQRAA
jgi:hypothetical protein